MTERTAAMASGDGSQGGSSGAVDPVRERRRRSGDDSGHRGAGEVRRGGARHGRRRGRGVRLPRARIDGDRSRSRTGSGETGVVGASGEEGRVTGELVRPM